MIRYDSTDLGSYTYLASGLGGFIDIAVDSKYIYAADGNYIHKMDINTGAYLGKSASQALDTVTVLKDGTVIGQAGTNLIYAYDPETLAHSQWTPTLYGGITDLAGGDDVVYAITGGSIYRLKSDGTSIHTANEGLTTVAVLPDGNVAAYSGNSAIRVYDGETLDYSHTTISGVGGFIDMAAGPDGIFTVDGSRVRNYPIAGGHAVDTGPVQSVNSVAYQFIPEPATMGLLGLGGLALLRRKRQ